MMKAKKIKQYLESIDEPVFFGLVLLLVLVYAYFFLTQVKVASDLHFAYRQTFSEQFSIPQTWQPYSGMGLGGNETLLLWGSPLTILTGLLGVAGASFSLTIKVATLLGCLMVGSWSIGKLLESLGFKSWVKIVGTFFYLSNTYILLIVDGGQISIALAYAIFPVAYLMFLRGVEGDSKEKVYAGLLVASISFLDIRFIYILLLLLLLSFLFKPSRVLGWVFTGCISGLITIGSNFYWVLPALLFNPPGLPATYLRQSQTAFLNFTQLKHAISLLQPHWYENVFGRIPAFSKEFLLIPLLALSAPALKHRDKQVWFWAIVAAVAVFLTKGANPPFPGVYPWLFSNIPGFSLFRDSTKFFFLVALAYSILIAFTVDAVTRRLPKLKVVFPLLLMAYFVFLIRPVWLGKMTGTFSTPRYQNEYFAVAAKLEQDREFGRVFWIPSRAPLGFSSPTHATVEANRLESLRPFAIATVGTYETQNFIREGAYMGELFDIAGIRYLAYPYFDPRRDDMKQERVDYYHTFSDQISKLPWVGEKISDVPITVYKTHQNEDKFFISPNTFLVVGSDAIYSEIAQERVKFADNALVFLEEKPGVDISRIPYRRIILNGKSNFDLAAAQLSASEFIFPARQLGLAPDKTGWWKREAVDLVWWRSFLQEKYGLDNLDFDFGGGWAVAEGEKRLLITNAQLAQGDVLLARVMRSSKGGVIEFWQGREKIGEINTKVPVAAKVEIKLTGHGKVPDQIFTYNRAKFDWIEVGELAQNGELTLQTKGDINVVNSLISINREDWRAAQLQANKLIAEKGANWLKLSANQKADLFAVSTRPTISYTRLAPTHYKVKVAGGGFPATLAFSETYDPLWTANSTAAYPLYSLINGFRLDRPGEYDVYFQPQQYVIPGLIISGIVLASCIMILVWPKLKKFF